MSQRMPFESVLPLRLLGMLITKADEVSRRFKAVPSAHSVTPGSSQLMEVAVSPSSSISTSTDAISVLDSGAVPTSSSAFSEEVASSVVQQSVTTAAHYLTGLSVQAPLELLSQLFPSAGLRSIPVFPRNYEQRFGAMNTLTLALC